MSGLTLRQREVLLLAANGNSNAAIANWLGVTRHSVAEILTAAYRRLGASDRAQAVAVALAVGELGVHQIVVPDAQREPAVGSVAAQAGLRGRRSAREAASGARLPQAATDAADGRTGDPGELAA